MNKIKLPLVPRVKVVCQPKTIHSLRVQTRWIHRFIYHITLEDGLAYNPSEYSELNGNVTLISLQSFVYSEF